MYYGKPVIAGNKDGSVDALANGKFGLLVNPDSIDEIKDAITIMLNNTEAHIPSNIEVMEVFSYATYKKKIAKILRPLYKFAIPLLNYILIK